MENACYQNSMHRFYFAALKYTNLSTIIFNFNLILKGEKETGNFLCAGLFLNVLNGQCWIELKPRARNLTQVFHGARRDPTPCAQHLLFPGEHISRKVKCEQSLHQSQGRHFDVGCGGCKWLQCCAKCLP